MAPEIEASSVTVTGKMLDLKGNRGNVLTRALLQSWSWLQSWYMYPHLCASLHAPRDTHTQEGSAGGACAPL